MIQVSQCKGKITPKGKFFPILMPNGYWAEDIRDEQFVSVLLLEIDQQRVCLISLDVIGLSKDYSQSLRQRLSYEMNMPIDHINIGYTHSHCAVHLGDMMGRKSDQAYLDYVADKVSDVCQQTLRQGLCEVDAYMRCYDASGFYSNRNGKEKLGDTEIKLLEFRTKDNEVKAEALIFACHSTVINFQNTRLLSSDLAGYLCRGIEKRKGLYPVVMLGAAGDMSNRCCRQGNDEAELKRVGDGLLSRMDMLVKEEKLNLCDLQVKAYQFKEKYVTTKQQRHQQIDDIKTKIEHAPSADLKRVFGSALEFALKEPDGGEFLLDLQGVVMKMNDVAIITMPAELFSSFGLEIKASMGVKCPIFWGYSNYSVGYLYHQEEVGMSFESAATNIPAGVSEEITEMCKKLVQ